MWALINIDVLYLQQTFETRKFVKLTSSAKNIGICPTYSIAWRSTHIPVKAGHLPFWKQNLRTVHHRYSRALTAICDAVCSGREAPTFTRNIMPTSSGYKHLCTCCKQDLNIIVFIICSLLYFIHRDSWHDCPVAMRNSDGLTFTSHPEASGSVPTYFRPDSCWTKRHFSRFYFGISSLFPC
jgi:hypothetical protein